MRELVKPKHVKEIGVKGKTYKTYKGRFLAPEHIEDPKIRKQRIKAILAHSNPSALKPGDFYFAWKCGLIKPNDAKYLISSDEIEKFRHLPSKERIKLLLEESSDLPIAYLARKYNFSDVYVRKLRSKKG